MRVREWTATLGVVVAFAALLTGCGTVEVGPQKCFPSRVHVAPGTAAPGETITVSSEAADCDLGYREGHTYSVAVIAPHHRSPESVVPVDGAGRFSAELTIPADFPSGDAWVVVEGSPYDHCDDTHGSCAGYTTALTIR